MVDAQKQINYWLTSSDEDFAAAQSLLEKGHHRHCLFFAHLAIEKMLKAHVTRQINDIPPRTHNLVRLAEIAQLKLDSEQGEFLREFGIYQLEGRYPDFEQVPVDSELAREEISRAKEMLIWLKTQL
jgi:HEPN domain-containing protein